MRTIRFHHGRKKIVGFTNGFVTYGRNMYGKYRLEANLDLGLFGKGKFKIYQGNKEPIIKDIWALTLLLAPLSPICIIFLSSLIILATYIEGAVNFVRDTAWQQSVREFHWMNILLALLVLVWLMLK